MSKFVTAFAPLYSMAAISYAAAASSCVSLKAKCSKKLEEREGYPLIN